MDRIIVTAEEEANRETTPGTVGLRALSTTGGRGGGGRGFSFSLGWMVRLSDAGTPASSISVADVLRINFASFQSSPVLCCKLTR